MNTIRIKCPAKINLTLEIVNKRTDGFHNIKSIMQMINLYDYLTINISQSDKPGINISGNSTEIPYDTRNLAYKAADLFLKRAKINNFLVDIYIEKNIPISAGLAGGSTDAAGVLFGLNAILKTFNNKEINDIASELGSDLNVCLAGGTVLATSRGEIIQPLSNLEGQLTLIKPKNLGISAGEAYKKYSEKENKPQNNFTEKMLHAIDSGENINQYLYNDLEFAVFDDYPQLQKIKTNYPDAIMSGSGSTYFLMRKIDKPLLNNEYEIIKNLHFISNGVTIDY